MVATVTRKKEPGNPKAASRSSRKNDRLEGVERDSQTAK